MPLENNFSIPVFRHYWLIFTTSLSSHHFNIRAFCWIPNAIEIKITWTFHILKEKFWRSFFCIFQKANYIKNKVQHFLLTYHCSFAFRLYLDDATRKYANWIIIRQLNKLPIIFYLLWMLSYFYCVPLRFYITTVKGCSLILSYFNWR